MSQPIFFTHANGFPSATYGKLFEALGNDYPVACLDQHGHDPRYPVSDNWPGLVDELLYHLSQQAAPVWGVGHSLGGLLHLHAALRCPQYYRGVVMLDSPPLTRSEQWVIGLAKRCGLIDRITPAGRTLGRRAQFADPGEAREYFAGKALFREFDPDCLSAYVEHGLCEQGAGLTLRFDPATEIAIYRSVPHRHPAPMSRFQLPLAVIGGERSRVVRPYHATAVRRLPRGEYHRVAGGHLFPMEFPVQTAHLLKALLERWSRT